MEVLACSSARTDQAYLLRCCKTGWYRQHRQWWSSKGLCPATCTPCQARARLGKLETDAPNDKEPYGVNPKSEGLAVSHSRDYHGQQPVIGFCKNLANSWTAVPSRELSRQFAGAQQGPHLFRPA